MDPLSLLTLQQVPGLGPQTLRALLGLSLPPITAPADLHPLLLAAKPALPRLKVPSPADLAAAAQRATALLAQAAAQGQRVLVGADLPPAVQAIPDPPVLLFFQGDPAVLDPAHSVAVVGTRTPTDYGRRMAHRLGTVFATQGWGVVSGLAAGCDTAAHEGTLAAGGRTLAILAHGLHMVFPAENRDLAARILAAGGGLLSEYPPGVGPQRAYFVARDRLQSAFSTAVVVVETTSDGGTMHTIRAAQAQGRLLACVAHPAKYATAPETAGNRALLAAGLAVPLGTAADLDGLLARLGAGGATPPSAAGSLSAASPTVAPGVAPLIEADSAVEPAPTPPPDPPSRARRPRARSAPDQTPLPGFEDS